VKGANQALSQGSFLLTTIEEQGDASKSDLMRTNSYASYRKNGSERLNFTAFNDALLEAKGIRLEEGSGNGKLLEGKTYTGLLDLKPVDEFKIRLGRRRPSSRLLRVARGLTLKEHQEKAVEASAEAAEG
jgi:hypothetical protein